MTIASTPENTAVLQYITVLLATYLYSEYDSEIDINVLTPEFQEEMNEYTQALLGNHNVLGVLIRGTDYILSKMGGVRNMTAVDDMLPMIHKWRNAEYYDFIFLATEYQDILARMKAEICSKLRSVSQVRHRIQGFGGLRLLSELEEKKKQDNSGLLKTTL